MLHKALEDAVEADLIRRNPAHAKSLSPKPEPVEMKVWTTAEVRTFLDSTEGDRLHACYLLALAHGLRHGELLGLRARRRPRQRPALDSPGAGPRLATR